MNIYPADIVDTDTDRAHLAAARAYLASRFYPPLPASYAEPMLAAIRLANGGDWDHDIVLPSDINPQPRGARIDGELLKVSPSTLIDALRLHHAINTDDQEV